MEKIEQLVNLIYVYRKVFKYKADIDIFDYLDEQAKKKKLKYIDKEILYRLLKRIYGNILRNNQFIIDLTNYIYPIYLWRLHKSLYKFDKEMAEVLINSCQEKDIFDFPCDVLITLPFNGMYIEYNIYDRYYGFFAYVRKNEEGNFNLELLMDYCDSSLFHKRSELDVIPFDLIVIELIHGNTIEKQIESAYRATNDVINYEDRINTSAIRVRYDKEICRAAISLLLYILCKCRCNAE